MGNESLFCIVFNWEPLKAYSDLDLDPIVFIIVQAILLCYNVFKYHISCKKYCAKTHTHTHTPMHAHIHTHTHTDAHTHTLTSSLWFFFAKTQLKIKYVH